MICNAVDGTVSRWTEIAGFCVNSTEPQGSNSEQTAAVLKTHFGQLRGTRWCSWLRQCVISRNVAGSIPSGVIVMFHWHNPSDPGVFSASNRNEISLGVKGAVASGWLPYNLHVPVPRSVQGLLGRKLKVGSSNRWVFNGSFSRVMGAFSHSSMNIWQWAVLVFVSWMKGIT